MSFGGELSLAIPELILAGAVLLLIVVGAVRGDGSTRLISGGAVIALVSAAVAAAWSPDGRVFAGGFVSDAAASYAKVFIYGLMAVAVPLGDRWMARNGNTRFEYPLLVLLAALGMGMTASTGDLISLFIGVELQSLSLYVLTTFQRDDVKGSEAGLKYFVLGALSSGLMLYGSSLIYGFAGSVRFDVIAAAVAARPEGPGVGLIFGLVFLMCGLAFKVSAAPFHMWTPDVYEGAPTPVVVILAGASKIAALVFIARVLADGFPTAVEDWRQVLIVISIISMALGAYAGLVQKNIKRLLAYSSIANMGYALLGLAAGTDAGLQAMLVFMVLYAIDSTGFFACLMALNRGGRAMERLEDFAGLSKSRPDIAIALTVLAFSAMGIPPMSGFWGKFFVFGASIEAGLWPVAVFGLVTSVVAAYYYLRLVKVMWFDPSPAPVDAPAGEARVVALGAAAFSFPLVLPALALLSPFALAGARAFGLAG
jgi:NADH-quinone oxidoreductase subunit N